MTNKWDERFITMSHYISTWSSCLRRNVGAVIVKNKRVIATGYNGAPEKVLNCIDKRLCLRDELKIESGTRHEFCYANHAEQNALLQAAKLGISVQDATLYCTHKPCAICLKMIINAGIKEVVYDEDYEDLMFYEILKDMSEKIVIRKYVSERKQMKDDKDKVIYTYEDIYQHLFEAYTELPSITIVNKMKELGFFAAPASSSHHLSYKSGLAEHSFNVAMNLLQYTQQNQLKWQKHRSPIVVGLLHDLCKCDQYVENSMGGWAWNKSVDSRHGIKSVELAKTIIPDLTDEEIACIEFHMGAFTDKSQWQFFGAACDKFENVMWTHQADMIATHKDEVQTNE